MEAMATPAFLVAEMRLAFRTCSRSYRQLPRRSFSGAACHRKDASPGPKQPHWPYNGALPPQRTTRTTKMDRGEEIPPSDSTELVPQQEHGKALDTGRKVPVPMRALPKAQITPNLKLSPRERLHIEVLTRQQPKPVEKPIYRERLQIYHIGSGKEKAIIFGKVLSITAACFTTFVVAPAWITAGVALPVAGLAWLIGVVPLPVIHYYYSPMASRIFLKLPAKARETSKAAMEYAKNLPRDVDLEIEYLQPWALPKKIKARVSELEPAQRKSVLARGVTFKWKDKFKEGRPTFCPPGFWVQPHSATGAASKDTIPGLWENVYKQLIARPEQNSQARWALSGNKFSAK